MPAHLSSLRSRLVLGAVAIGVLVLVGLSALHSYSMGHHTRMYDDPVYRWRESLAIALSRLQDPPLHRYLAYRSIRDYLAEHGLGLVVGEAKVMPTPEERRALTQDTARMNRLIEDASRTPIDRSLAPVTLTGNELGLVDFFYWSFRIFGLNIRSFVLLYYTALLVSAALFFVTFWRSPFCLLLLLLYLAAHDFAVHYADISQLQTVHNSRFFPVLSLLPAMHLLLLLVRGAPPSLINIAAAAVQTFLLFFVLFCRNQAFWQVFAILAAAPVAVKLGPLWNALPRPSLWPAAVKEGVRNTWAALLVLCGLFGYMAYNKYAPDPQYYGMETEGHVFWHAIYTEMISADPELMARYGYGLQPHTDALGHLSVLYDLRGRNEAPKDLAKVVDGVLNIDVLKGTAEFDASLRRIFFDVLAEHPWLVMRSFLLGKFVAQYRILRGIPLLREPYTYVGSLAMALGAIVLALMAGLAPPGRIHIRRGLMVLIVVVIFSFMTTFLVPSDKIPDVLTFYVLLGLLGAVYLPLLLLRFGISANDRREE